MRPVICGALTRRRVIWVHELYCGRTAEAAAHLPDAIALAERVGHHGAAWSTKARPGP